MKVLLHICCAPCSIECIKYLRNNNYEVDGYWYNPNIHPYIEYTNRKNALINYSKDIGLNVIYNDVYGLVPFTKNVINNLDNRCEYCYTNRLEETFKYASYNNYGYVTTSLLVSPYQKHDLIIDICKKLSMKYNVKFLYHDFRLYFREGQNIARKENLYMQKYCGCIFSEEDRYKK